MADDYNCARCNTYGSRTEATKMADSYIAVLCIACRNEWDEYIDMHPFYTEATRLRVNEMSLHAMTYADGVNRADAIMDNFTLRQMLTVQLRALAKRWVAMKEDV